MKRQVRDRKNIRLGLILILLAGSLALNVKLFTEYREGKLAVADGINRTMSIVQSADSQLNAAIYTIEDGAGAPESLYAIGIVQTRLAEAKGLLRGLDRYESFEMVRTIYAFEYYLSSELQEKWVEGDAAVDASREKVLAELRSMKLDLSALASLGQQTSQSAYDVNELSEQWKLTMERRIQEDPDTFVHKELQ